MFKRLGLVLTMFAFLSALGAHWVVLQSVAWTSMLAANLQTQSLSGAVERTFDGRHPCPLCTKIAKSKHQENKPEFSLDLKKFEFTFTPASFRFCRSWHSDQLRLFEPAFHALTHPPPVPPPRALAA